MWHVWGSKNLHIEFRYGNLKERDHLESLERDWSIILKWALNNMENMWSGLIWLNTRTNGAFL